MEREQFIKISKWQRETFGNATPLSKLHHLKQELNELQLELESNKSDSDILKEFADCFILLFGAADSFGLSYGEICNCIDAKMAINYKRIWGNPDNNGVVNHIK